MEKVNPVLTKGERKLIKKIARIQIRSLTKILNNDVPDEDVDTICLVEHIDKEELMGTIKNQIGEYKMMVINPGLFFNTRKEESSTNMHILMNFFEHPKYEVSRKAIFRKMLYLEPIPIDVSFSLN